MDAKHCHGCEDDFYNGHNPMNVKKCWGLKTARLITRYRIGTWTVPTQSGAFTEVKAPTCYHAKGEHYYEKLPSFVKSEDVNRLKRNAP